MKKHKYYARWLSFIQRCYDSSNKNYPSYGGKGITVAKVWIDTNPEGICNFIKWVDRELSYQPELINVPFKVIRLDVTKNFSPNNCCLSTIKSSCKNRSTTVLNAETVIEMRRIKKMDMEMTLAELETKYNTSQANISRALRGVTWSSVDDAESPIQNYRERLLT
jgi:hypothetical protein